MSASQVTRGPDGEFRAWGWQEVYDAKHSNLHPLFNKV
jgi:hypothetical protein